jgi:acyl-CoA synthetase (NDP forming)
MGGGFVLQGLRRHGFDGRIIPVNPRYQEIDGLPCFSSLSAVNEDIDLAVFAVPAGALTASLREARPHSIKTALVLTSGYSEAGEEGERLERELLDLVREKSVRLIGPNSVGLANLENGVVTTISQAFDRTGLKTGDVALISQSGAFGTALVARAQEEGVGFRYFISSGNEADAGFSDLARALIARDDVRILCGYLENIRDGKGFTALATVALELGKPLIVLKAGSSTIGSRAARSHTGALVGSDSVAQSIFDAYGIIRAKDGEHLLELLKVFARTQDAKGKRIAVVSHSGGAGVLAADAAESQGAQMPPLPSDVQKTLREMLPAYATVANPLDMTGAASLQAKLMAQCLKTMLAGDAYDAGLLCVALIWREGATLFDELSALAASSEKPFAVSWAAPAAEIAARLRTGSFPVFADPSRAAAALARKLRYDVDSRGRTLHDYRPIRDAAIDEGLLETVAGQIDVLERYGVPLPKQTLATTLADAERFRASLDRPVVVKIASADIVHRTESGGVIVGVKSAEELAEAYERVVRDVTAAEPGSTIEGVLVQEMIEDGLHVFVGTKRDPTFGPMIAAGPGGTLVELIARLAMRPAPVDLKQALEMLGSPPLDALLRGFRGGAELDREALASAVVAISLLALDAPRAAEIEFNPLIVLSKGAGCAAVDYKFRLLPSAADPTPSSASV